MTKTLTQPVFALFLLIFMGIGSAKSQGTELIRSDSILIDEPVSSNVIGISGVTSLTHCVVSCRIVGCAVASLSSASGFCQVIVLNNASTSAGPQDTHVRRTLVSDASNQVWKTADFEQQLASKRFRFRVVFSNSSTGRNGTVQSVTLPATFCYRVEATGARGGSSFNGVSPGGNGARMVGNFNLTAGTELAIVVGQRGGNASHSAWAGSGGGGGSFVYFSANNSLLLAAGGGGGTRDPNMGSPGQMTTNGSDTPTTDPPKRGFGGSQGQAGILNAALAVHAHYFGGPGAGWLNRSFVAQREIADGQGGGSRADGWLGGAAGNLNSGAVGGFGGGGGGGNGCGGSGGGGGYSGGGASITCDHAGGGGGSFCSGSDCSGATGGNTDGDHGTVVIQVC